MKNQDELVVVGMSGGVDSSVTAAILKEQGYRVVGLFMRNWEELDENGVCTSQRDYQDVVKVCEKLDIDYYTIDFVEEYRKQVFDDFVAEIKKGLTPNPDVLCNREIKFKVFFEQALQLGADYLATGHYCRVGESDGRYKLLKGLDNNKDQSYFLNSIPGEVLSKVLFPLGELEKPQVRDIARKFDLSTKEKKDSTGICFIGERNFENFISQYIRSRPGDFVDTEGKVVGQHNGAVFYTIGQRKGLGIGARKDSSGEPWFVVEKDLESNQVIVAQGHQHPRLMRKWLIADDISWIDKAPQFPFTCQAKIRYRQQDQSCVISQTDEGRYKVEFDDDQRAMTIGQYVVIYQGEICLGGGPITELGPHREANSKKSSDS